MTPGSIKNSYQENVYEMLKSRGLADKYEHPGIYSISIDNILVYIGKSTNMLRRLAQHWVGISNKSAYKYKILSEAGNQGHRIRFDVIYYAKGQTESAIVNEIGEKEGQFIRAQLPVLNYQIPKEEDWHKYTVNKTAATITLEEILLKQNPQIQKQQISNITGKLPPQNLNKRSDKAYDIV